jgi:hypothetical protein
MITGIGAHLAAADYDGAHTEAAELRASRIRGAVEVRDRPKRRVPMRRMDGGLWLRLGVTERRTGSISSDPIDCRPDSRCPRFGLASSRCLVGEYPLLCGDKALRLVHWENLLIAVDNHRCRFSGDVPSFAMAFEFHTGRTVMRQRSM